MCAIQLGRWSILKFAILFHNRRVENIWGQGLGLIPTPVHVWWRRQWGVPYIVAFLHFFSSDPPWRTRPAVLVKAWASYVLAHSLKRLLKASSRHQWKNIMRSNSKRVRHSIFSWFHRQTLNAAAYHYVGELSPKKSQSGRKFRAIAETGHVTVPEVFRTKTKFNWYLETVSGLEDVLHMLSLSTTFKQLQHPLLPSGETPSFYRDMEDNWTKTEF